MSQTLDLEQAVVAGWVQTAAELPDVRVVLDRYRAAPIDDAMDCAMIKATAREYMLLALAAGRSAVQDPTAAPWGAEIEAKAGSHAVPSRW